jgi:tetratricopeptide (TPR) repeat protein
MQSGEYANRGDTMRLGQFTFSLLIAAAVACWCAVVRAQQPPSPRDQLNHYIADLQKNPSDGALREKIIKLVLGLDPKPATPDDAAVAAAKGKTIFEHTAQTGSKDDLKAAADAFAQASVLAPWVADYYFNQGSALEKAGQFEDAIRALDFYLVAAPNASDANDVRGKIEGIKYEKEKAAKEEQQTAERKVEVAAERQRQFLARLIGTWKVSGSSGSSDTYSFSATGGNAFRIDWTSYDSGQTGARSGTNSIELRGTIAGYQVSGSYSYSYTVPRGYPCPGQHEMNGRFTGSVSEDGRTLIADIVRSGVLPDFPSGGCRDISDQSDHKIFAKE